MKILFVVCAVLSGLVFTGFVLSIHGCGEVYEIDGQGRLVSVTRTPNASGPPTVVTELRSWESNLPEFKDVAPRLKPGDRLYHLNKTAGGPPIQVSMTTLEVTRDGEVIKVYQDRFIPFWGTIVGVSAIPLTCWGLGMIWISTSPSRRRKPGE